MTGKSYNYKIILYLFQALLRNSLDPNSGVFQIRIRVYSGSGFRFLAGSGFNEYGSETLAYGRAAGEKILLIDCGALGTT